jgi:hypothetical protein
MIRGSTSFLFFVSLCKIVLIILEEDGMLDQAEVTHFRNEGYVIIRGLFAQEEVSALCDHYMRLRAQGPYPGDSSGVPLAGQPGAEDPWKRYPRMIHMHRWDPLSLRWFLDTRLRDSMQALLGKEPYAVQTMFYFKPPGARGQALHQDQYYLRAQPGTCIAAWMAVDPCDEENGCLQVVPGSQRLPVLCTTKADTNISFTDVTVPLPAGMQAVPVIMQPGDVLFFNGQLVHGSLPNTSSTRFRRALIGHYIVAEAQKVAEFYHPILRMDGTTVDLEVSQGGGACGVWVERDGRPMVEMTAALAHSAGHE